jgi:hypothetical protein
MTFKKSICGGLAALLILAVGLAACSSGSQETPTPSPVAATDTAAPTDTLEPTRTPLPTDTPLPDQTGLTQTPAATGDAAAGNATGGAAGSPTGQPTTGGAAPTQAPATGGAAAGSSVADQYQYVTQNLPDHLQVRPGTQMTITWTVKNAGTTGWTKEYALRYFSGIQAAKDIYYLTKDVPAGSSISLSVPITAPSALGEYNTWWKLTNAQNQNFGDVDFTFTVTNNPTKATAAAPTTAPAVPTATTAAQ